jgi:uncharacterized membrane protein YcaP (DUF421 family)
MGSPAILAIRQTADNSFRFWENQGRFPNNQARWRNAVYERSSSPLVGDVRHAYLVYRLLGKRMMAQLPPMDRVAGIAPGTVAGSAAITRTIPSWAGVLAIGAFAAFAWGTGWASVAYPSLRRWLMGKPRALVVGEHVDAEGMRQPGLSSEDLWTRLRELKIRDLADVELAELERDGKLRVVERAAKSASSKSPAGGGRAKKSSPRKSPGRKQSP